MFIAIFTTSSHLRMHTNRLMQSVLFKIYCNFSHLRLVLSSGLLPSCLHSQTLCSSLFHHSCYLPVRFMLHDLLTRISTDYEAPNFAVFSSLLFSNIRSLCEYILGWPYTEVTWLYCDYFIWCVSYTVVVLTCFVMCGVWVHNVWLCVCVSFEMCGCVYVYGFCNVLVCVYVWVL